MPDWVLKSMILDRPVSPAESDRLEKDGEYCRRSELLRAIGEENEEFFAGRSDLIDYAERLLLQPPDGR